MSLTIFNESNGIYPGINTPQFSQLENLVVSSVKKGKQIPNLGLFGEASTGKTTTTNKLADYCKYHFISLNASSLSPKTIHAFLHNKLTKILEPDSFSFGKTIAYGTEPTLILIDEAHLLHKDIQNMLLTCLETGGPFFEDGNKTFLTRNITFVFATTDSSKLAYPLTTRLTPIIFDQYTNEDICHMINLKHPSIILESASILAKCSKLVPRVAIKLASQFIELGSGLTKDDTINYVRDFHNMDENGIDSIDHRIILYLTANKRKIDPVDEFAYENFKIELAKLDSLGSKRTQAQHNRYNSLKFKVFTLEQRLSVAEYVPKSRQDIALGCRLLDMANLESRLSYLEKLNLITKTPKGILLTND